MNSATVQLYLIAMVFITTCSAQLHYFQQQAGVYRTHSHYHLEPNLVASSPVQQDYSHPAVVANSRREAELPSELLKSERFYKNPHIAAALAKESWFTDKEMPVIDREAEKIPRERIYKIFHNAGWIRRR